VAGDVTCATELPLEQRLEAVFTSPSLHSFIPPSSLRLDTENDPMSLISSFIIDPVVRAGRRLSGASRVPPAGDAAGLPLSHANQNDPTPTPTDSDAIAAIDAPQVLEGRSESRTDRFRRYSSFSRRPHDDVVHEQSEDGPSGSSPTAPIDIINPADTVGMSSNESHMLRDRFGRLDLNQPGSAPAQSTTRTTRSGAASGQQASAMSESLPADDGMAYLRERIHQVRALKVSEQERAQLIHGLMIERYSHMRPTSPSSFVSHDRPVTPASGQSVFSDIRTSTPSSTVTDDDRENPFNLRPGDTSPTYRPVQHDAAEHGDDDDDECSDEDFVLGCQHYKRNVKVQCHQCRHWYTCRHCHDEVEDHALNRKMTENMLCMACGTPQKAADSCKSCETLAACYYCDICKLWDNNSRKKIYHCPDCGICRRGEGLGKDYTHCKVNTVRISSIGVINPNVYSDAMSA
jgi:uncharacterized CHY-type Zn-finger protein